MTDRKIKRIGELMHNGATYQEASEQADKEAKTETKPEPPDNPETLQEWLWRVKRNEKGIYVREQVDGKWGNARLSDLSPERWAYWVARWLSEGAIPVRIKEKGEKR